MRYENKVTIITGGTKGIGEGCVRVFVEAGAAVVFCARNEAQGKALESEMNALNNALNKGEAHFIKCDVSNVEEVENLITATVEKFGRIDCLINNAGWHPPHKPIDDFSAQDFRDILELNLVSMFAAHGGHSKMPFPNE